MKPATKSRRRSGGKRRAPARTKSMASAGEFLRRTFYYLKGEQLLKATNRLLCEAC